VFSGIHKILLEFDALFPIFPYQFLARFPITDIHEAAKNCKITCQNHSVDSACTLFIKRNITLYCNIYCVHLTSTSDDPSTSTVLVVMPPTITDFPKSLDHDITAD